MRALLRLALCIAVVGSGLIPLAAAANDPYNAVDTMRMAFSRVRSATAVERFGDGSTATVEYTWPNRYHIQTRVSEISLSGNVEYARYSGGKWVRSDHGAETAAMMNAIWQLAGPPGLNLHKLYTIRSLGNRTIEGQRVRGYKLHETSGAYDETVWIGPNYLPVVAQIRMPDQVVDIHYVGYNVSTLVATPQ